MLIDVIVDSSDIASALMLNSECAEAEYVSVKAPTGRKQLM